MPDTLHDLCKCSKPASNLAAPLKIVGHPAPFARDEFSQARGALGRNLFLCTFPCLFALLGFAGALIPGKGLVERSVAAGIGIVAGWIGLYFGKQAAQQARYLGCPGCKDLLSSQSESVLLTGRCRKCGAVVLSDQPASASEPKDVAEPQIAPVPSRATSRPSATLPRKFGPDRRRLWDVVVLFLFPAVCVLLLMGQKSNLGLAVFFGVMALVYSGKYYLFPDPDEPEDSSPPRKRAAQKRSAKVSDASNAETGAVAIADKTPWLDFGLILLLPVTVVVWLLYLVWTHTVLGRLGLAAATVAIPAAVVLVSWFVVQHEGHQVKKTGKPAPMTLMWGLLAIWAAAVFVFVVCLVSWIEKFGFQW